MGTLGARRLKPYLKICRIDFDIWDAVLARHPGMRLETISRAQDRRDANLMLGILANKPERAGSLVNVLRALHYSLTGDLLK